MTSIEFNTRLTEHNQYLNMAATKFANNHDDIKDLIQDTYIKALTYKDKFKESTNFKAWLYTIMKNTAINDFRKRSNTYKLIEEGKADYSPLLSKISFHSAESLTLKNEIQQAINELDDDFKIPFELYIKGYKYKEIEEFLNIPLGTVKSRIFFARKKLASLLNEENMD